MPSLKGKVANRRFVGRVFAFSSVEKVSRSDGWGVFKNIFSDKYKLAINTPSLKGKVANRRFVGRVFAFSFGRRCHISDR